MVRGANEVIGFIGGGNMATALVRGLLGSGREKECIVVAEPDDTKRAALEKTFGVAVDASNVRVAKRAQMIVLAVKPQIIDQVLAEIGPVLGPGQTVVSIAAGIRLDRLESGLGGSARVVRAMPNTPSLVSRGAAVLCAGAHATDADLNAAHALFETVGQAHVVDDESLMDAVTALSGSGPAYVYRLAEALIEAGARCGLQPDLATALAFQTIAGAAEMMLQTGESPAKLRAAVSSPGGTTVAGLNKLEEMGFASAIVSAVEAAANRSRELGAG